MLKRIGQDRFFNVRAVSRDVSQPEGLKFGHIKPRLAGAPFEEPDQLLQATAVIFSPLKKPHWNAPFRSGWTDWQNVMWQLVV
jgi:hypothetical protein